MCCRTALNSALAEVTASLLQVNRWILHTLYTQVSRDFSGDFACMGHARSGLVGSASVVAWLRYTLITW